MYDTAGNLIKESIVNCDCVLTNGCEKCNKKETMKNDKKTYTDPITGKFIEGNPGGGVTKGSRHFGTLFRDAVKRIAKGGKDKEDILIVKKVIEKAKKGDLKAAEMIFDRVDGKPLASIDITTDGDKISQETMDIKKILADFEDKLKSELSK